MYESEEPSYRSKVGPAIADLKPSSKPKKPTPKPSYKAPAKPKTKTTAIAKTSSKAKPKPASSRKPKAKNSDSSSELAKAAALLAEKAGVSDTVTKKIITEATPAADVIAKTLKEKKEEGSGDLEKMKIAPRTLIASLEKYIPLEAEQLIGEGNAIDLDASDLEPVTTYVKSIAKSGISKTQQSILKAALDPADMPALDPADMPAIDPADVEAGETGSTLKNSQPGTTPVPAPSGQIQPLGMSFFERFALSTMVASENHLATIPTSAGKSATLDVSTEGEERIPEPVIVEDPEAVKFQSNDIPASHVSPGLDEMVISSTSQTDFDLNDSEMAFIGNVQVKSPRFNLRADKFIVHLKKDNSGMAYGEAIGNVVIEMRENGRPTGYSGLASNAVYHPDDGKIVLSGWPKIRQQFKEHVAITRDTKMVLYTDGRVKTIGRNRTVIRN